jgi:hypothetical protein
MIGVFIAAFVCGVGAVIVIALRLSNRTQRKNPSHATRWAWAAIVVLTQ